MKQTPRGRTADYTRDCAASEVVSTIMMVSLVVAAVTVTMFVVFSSYTPPQKIPSFSAIVTNQSCIIFLYHDGGDSLQLEKMQILVDSADRTADFTMRGKSGATTWETGDTLVNNPSTCNEFPGRVDIVYDNANIVHSAVFRYITPPAGTGTTTATTTAPSVDPPVADFKGDPLSGTEPLYAGFQDQSTNTPTSWSWGYKNSSVGWTNFGSGSWNPTFSFAAGTYDINLTATNEGGSNTVTKTGYLTVTALPPPVADFRGDPLSGYAPLLVRFEDGSTNTPTSWKWQYRNATTGWTQFNDSSNTPTFSFPAGTYSINLTATNEGGSSNLTRNNYITVAALTPVASFTGIPLTGSTPLSVQFTDSSTNNPTSWKWGAKNQTPGNNSWIQPSTSQNPLSTFGVGNWSINLTATNAGGSNISTQVTWVNVSGREIKTLVVYLTEDTADEYMGRTTSGTWSTLRNGAGDISGDGTNTAYRSARIYVSSSTPQIYNWLYRLGYGFNTSAIPDDAEILSARFSVWGQYKTNGLGSQNVGITGFSPAIVNNFAAGDYASFGSVRYANDITYANFKTDWSDYNNFTFNSDGIAAINKAGYTNFMFRTNSDIDNSNSTLTWSSGTTTAFRVWDYLEDAAKQPLLTITYQ